MALVGKLDILLSAKTGALEKQLKKARTSISGFTKSIKMQTRAIRGWGAALTAAVAGGAFTAVIKQQFEAIDKIDKTSTKLGIQAERLQELQYAAQLSGVEVQAFNVGLQRMTRRLAAGEEVTGGVAEAISALGLSAGKLASMSPDQQFLAIADGMAAMDDQGQRILHTFALFDTEGVGLVTLLQQGGDAVRAFAREAHAIGAIVDEKQIKQVVEANDAVTKMRASVTGIARRMAADLAPAIKVIATDMTDLFSSGATAAEKMEQGTSRFQNFVIGISDFVTVAQIGLISLNAGLEVTWGLLQAAAWAAAKLFQQDTTGLEESIKATEDRLKELRKSLDDAAENFTKIREAFMPLVGPTKGDSAVAEMAKDADELQEKLQQAQARLERIGQIAEENKSPWTKLTEQLDELRDLEGAGLDPRQAEMARQRLIGDYRQQVGTPGIRGEAEETAKAITDRLDEFAGRFATPQEKFTDAIGEVATLLSEGLPPEIAQRAIIDAIKARDDAMPTGPQGMGAGAALAQGTAAAFSAEVNKQIDIGRSQLAAADEANVILDNILTAVGGNAATAAPGI